MQKLMVNPYTAFVLLFFLPYLPLTPQPEVLQQSSIHPAMAREGIWRPAYVSRDAGNHWTADSFLLPPVDIVTSLASSEHKVYAATKTEGIYLSADGRKTWIPVNEGLPDKYVRAMAAQGPQLLAGTNAKGVFLSADGGQSWKPVNGNLPAFLQVFSVAMYQKHWMIGTNHGIYTTGDGGQNWVQVYQGNGYAITVHPFYFIVSTMQNELLLFSHLGWPYGKIEAANPTAWKGIAGLVSQGNMLLAGTQNEGIWMSADQGKSWTLSGSGLPPHQQISGFYREGKHLYAFPGHTLENQGC